MKRIRIVGLCLVAAFAMSAVIANAAQAAPEYFTCIKAVPKKTGNYATKECATKLEGEEAGTGKYERSSEVAGGKVKSKTGTAVLSTPALGGKVTCKKSKSLAEVTSTTETEVTVEFKKCETEGKPCNSAGAGKGKIVTNPLVTTLVEVGAGEAAAQFTAVGGVENYQAEFECEGLLIRTKGFTDGVITEPAIGHAGKKATLVFAGEEELRTEVSVDGGLEWIGEEFGGFPSEENVTASNKNKPALGVEL